MSPTTIFSLARGADAAVPAGSGVGGCTRGSGGGVYPGCRLGGSRGGLYRYPARTIPGAHIEHNLASGPYLRPNEGEFSTFNEVS